MGIWDEGFEEPKVQFPEALTKDYIKSFDTATEGYASLTLLKLDALKKMVSHLNGTNFQYQLLLTSDFASGYSFKVFRFGYDVTIYPVYIVFEDEIGEELGIPNSLGDRAISIENEADFSKIMEGAFKSKRFREVVGGLIKIAKAKAENAK